MILIKNPYLCKEFEIEIHNVFDKFLDIITKIFTTDVTKIDFKEGYIRFSFIMTPR